MSLLFVFIAVSCTNDGGDSVINLSEGALPNITKDAGTDQGINILKIENGEDLNLGLTLNVATGQVASMDVVGYFTKNGVVTKAVLQPNVTTFPAKLNYKKADLVKAFPNFLSFGTTDKLIITADLTLKNGTVIKTFTDKGAPNYGSDIANSTIWIVSQTYTALCPFADASVFAGDYEVVQDQWEDYVPGDVIHAVYNPADGTYSFRLLSNTNIYIANSATAYLLVTINPATNAVTVKSSEIYNYGAKKTSVKGTGTISFCTGEIDLKLDFPEYPAAGAVLKLVKI